MLIRRCQSLLLRPKEDLALDWTALFKGEGALQGHCVWVALAGHRDSEVVLDAASIAMLVACSESLWTDAEPLVAAHGQATLDYLIDEGLLLVHEGGPEMHRAAEERLRAQYWHPLSAVAHRHSRWLDTLALDDPNLAGYRDIREMIAALGPPPPASRQGDGGDGVELPAASSDELDAWLMRRYTGRNYDAAQPLPLISAARILQRTFGAQGRHPWAPEAMALKKTSPSGGGLHPIDAFVIARNVQGLPQDVYYYHPESHRLLRRESAGEFPDAAMSAKLVAGQEWFVDAALWVVLVARVRRNFWKYRRHPKAYRALVLDAGHLSQTFYLLATESGVPAFITAAVNEAKWEKLLGLTPEEDAVIAVCGCGPASAVADTVEFRAEEIRGVPGRS